jgi:uncharacterized protein YlxW (UPF0749 family)
MRPFRLRTEAERPIDWSMDLLNSIQRTPVDPDYAKVAAEGRPRRSRALVAIVCVGLGVLLAVQGRLTFRTAPDLEQERRDVITRLTAVEQNNERLRGSQEQVAAEVRAIQAAAGAGNQERVDAVEPVVGVRAVVGPGLVYTVDDADGAGRSGASRVADIDLRMLTNGLWAAGAEAIAINGYRVTSRTAIRTAGSAITVNYRSLTRPYRIEAIGDPRTLQSRFAQTQAGAWWQALRDNYGMRYEVVSAQQLKLPADPGLTVTHATPGP